MKINDEEVCTITIKVCKGENSENSILVYKKGDLPVISVIGALEMAKKRYFDYLEQNHELRTIDHNIN